MTRRLLAKQSGVRSTFIGYTKQFDNVTVKESTLERDYYNWMLFTLPHDAVFIMQPNKFYYELNGKPTHYTSDGHITFPCEKIWIDEVKYYEESIEPAVLHKHQVLKGLLEEDEKKKTTFRVLTERDIRIGERAENYKMLKPCLHHPAPVKVMEALLSKVKQPQLSLWELYTLADNKRINRSVIKNAVAHKLLKTDLTKAWNELVFTW